jgi:hypothetical protein
VNAEGQDSLRQLRTTNDRQADQMRTPDAHHPPPPPDLRFPKHSARPRLPGRATRRAPRRGGDHRRGRLRPTLHRGTQRHLPQRTPDHHRALGRCRHRGGLPDLAGAPDRSRLASDPTTHPAQTATPVAAASLAGGLLHARLRALGPGRGPSTTNTTTARSRPGRLTSHTLYTPQPESPIIAIRNAPHRPGAP